MVNVKAMLNKCGGFHKNQEALHVQWAMQEHSSQLSVSLKNRRARYELAKNVSKEHLWFWNNIV